MARADAAARELLEKVGWKKPPVEPDRIAREAFGAVIAMVEMSSDMSGMLMREPERVVIGVNSTHHETRQKFTMAHELGHLVLHRGRSVIMDSDVRVNFRDRVSSLATDREEIEANRFAAALLLPEHMVRSWIAETSITDAADMVKKLAGAFEVSKPAANYRLVNLGVFPTPLDPADLA